MMIIIIITRACDLDGKTSVMPHKSHGMETQDSGYRARDKHVKASGRAEWQAGRQADRQAGRQAVRARRGSSHQLVCRTQASTRLKNVVMR